MMNRGVIQKHEATTLVLLGHTDMNGHMIAIPGRGVHPRRG